MSVLSKLLKGNKKKRGKKQEIKNAADNEFNSISYGREEMRLKNEIRKLERKEKVLLRKRQRLEERRLAVYNKERIEDNIGKGQSSVENIKKLSAVHAPKDIQEQTEEKSDTVEIEESKAKIMLMKNDDEINMDCLD